MAGHVVTGAAVVLQVRGGGERYLYRGAPIPENVYYAESVKHAVDVGLVEAVPDEPVVDVDAERVATAAREAAEKQSAQLRAAAEKKAGQPPATK